MNGVVVLEKFAMGRESQFRILHSRVLEGLLVAPTGDFSPKAIVPRPPADDTFDG